jgi:hypothetical protein
VTVSWRRPVVFVHRWLGIALGAFFATWFASGIVMIYARMPRLAPAERLARLEPLDLSRARLSPPEVIGPAESDDLEEIRIQMWLGRPVYRARRGGEWETFSALTGDRVAGVTADDAIESARRFAGIRTRSAIRYDRRIERPDQWTFDARRMLPAHRIALGDADGTYVYVSERSGEVILRTTRRERRAAYVGAVLHWLYFTPFRRHDAVWSQTIIWMSVAGSVMCLLGLIWGVSAGIRSPYRGWMRWHHYVGLIFGVVTFAWIFSGLLSMDPWDWHPSTAADRTERHAFSGGPGWMAQVTLTELRTRAAGAREIELVPFRGRARLLVDGRADGRLDRTELIEAAMLAMPGARLRDASWLESYDAFYYDRTAELPLPVLRVRFDDPASTWLYIDGQRGTIARKEERLTRVNRWLYHGLHSLDFPFLYYRRPLWDIVVICLSVGGLLSVVTAAVPGWHRVRRLTRPRRRSALMADDG